ncbi:BspA family leucine-rich repeat surface protein [Mycoplasma putrefaciens]|uniref:PARCEL domain protein n=1 Tax=Mycoplasma putrefaciens (strain ATCC 15718 / NCTC 10155 / C30 KS-1 / KS-1) TaxID=743965 RepID=A0A7U3ZSB6_MYCPK|nr:BspA family leucine-rich repeat surface protein [Mycoplasma putrefaciens]AEM68621.1 PARCEL domain protein [Mycoplasma putrefaciens KS1]
MDKNNSQNQTQNQVDQIKNPTDNQQLTNQDNSSENNKKRLLKILAFTGLIVVLVAAATTVSVVKFCQVRSNQPDTKPDPAPAPNPDNSDKSPTPVPSPEELIVINPISVDDELSLSDLNYIKRVWDQHFKDKRSSLETFQDVEDSFKYVLKEARPKIKDLEMKAINMPSMNNQLGLDRNDYKFEVTYENQTFDLEFGKINDSQRPSIIKILNSFENSSDNNKLFSVILSKDTTNHKKIDFQKTDYQVLQLGYHKVKPTNQELVNLESYVQVIAMPGKVKQVPEKLAREITSLKAVFADSKFDKKISGIDKWDTSNIKNMSRAFDNSIFNDNLSNWNTSNVVDMSSMFANSPFNNSSIANWDTSNVVDMSSMFAFNKTFDQDISTKKVNNKDKSYVAWNTSKVKSMSSMFQGAETFNKKISNWDTSQVTRLDEMFDGAKLFNQEINTKWVTVGTKPHLAWDILNVKKLNGMFKNAEAFNQNIDSWNTSKVEDIYQLFKNAKMFSQNINTKHVKLVSKERYLAWDTSKVTSLEGVFWGAKAFNGDISIWNTSKVENLDNIFRDAEKFNRNIDFKRDVLVKSEIKHYLAWDVKNVKSINYGFYNAKSFNQNLSNWNVDKLNKSDKGKDNWDTGATKWNSWHKPKIKK